MQFFLIIRERLESAQEEWQRLTGSLEELIYWSESRSRSLLADQPVGGSLTRLQGQAMLIKVDMVRLIHMVNRIDGAIGSGKPGERRRGDNSTGTCLFNAKQSASEIE